MHSLLTKDKIYRIYIPFLIIISQFVWKWLHISDRDICLDEPFTLFHSQQSLEHIIMLPTQNEPHPPLFNIIVHIWIELFGLSANAVRVIPLIFSSLTILLLYRLAYKYFGLMAALFVNGIFLFSFVHFYYALETRQYSMLAFLSLSSLYFFSSYLFYNDKKKRNFILLLISNVFLIYTHYFGLLLLFTQFVTSLIFYRKKDFTRVFYNLIITAVLYAPMWYVLIQQFLISKNGTWVQPPQLIHYLSEIYYFFNSKETTWGLFALILLSLIVFYKSSISQYTTNKKILITFLIWFILPYTMMFVASYKTPMFIGRYVLFNSIPLYLLVTGLIFSKKPFGIFNVILTIIGIYIMSQDFRINDKNFYYREVKNAVNKVKQFENYSSSHLTFIYPHWLYPTFTYHYNIDLFQIPDSTISLLENQNIHPIWNITSIKEVNQNKVRNIIIYTDVSMEREMSDELLKIQYEKDTMVFYPQSIGVIKYTKSYSNEITKDTTQL